MGLERINELRKNRGYTLEDLSEKSGVPVSTLKKISAGITTNPSLDTVKAIVHALGYTLDDLDRPLKKAPAEQELSKEEQQLIDDIRSMPGEYASAIFLIARGMPKLTGERPPEEADLRAAAEIANQLLERLD